MSNQLDLFKVVATHSYTQIASVDTKRKAYNNTQHDSAGRVLKMRQNHLSNIYANSAIARQVVDAPANDAISKWRTWETDEANIQLLQAEENRLELLPKLIDAMAISRLFGGCAILIGTVDSDYSLPLDPTKLSRGGITHLTLMPRFMFNNIDFQRDVGIVGYGQPTMFHHTLTIATAGTEADVTRIHPSRLIVIRGERVLDSALSFNMDEYWGDSILQNKMNAIDDLESSFANTALMMFEARTPVLAIEGVLRRAAEENEKKAGSGDIKAAAIYNAFNVAKGNANTTIIDKDTMEYKVHNFNFTGIPDIIQQQIERVAGESGIPISILFGKQVTGLGNSGLGDRLNYFQVLSGLQRLKIQPAMKIMDIALIRSAGVTKLDPINYTWNDLGETNDLERASIFRLEVEGVRKFVEDGFLTQEQATVIVGKILKDSGLAVG